MTGAIGHYADLADGLRQRRRDWLPIMAPAGRIESGTFYLGDATGSPGRSFPIPLDGSSPKLQDFGGDFAGDDLDLAAAINFGGDLDRAAEWARGVLGIERPGGSYGDAGSYGGGASYGSGPAPAASPDDKFARRRAFLQRAGSIADTIAVKYLQSRGINGASAAVMAFAPSYPNPKAEGKRFPVLLCIARDEAGEPVAYQAIYLRPDGTGKADAPKTKITYGLVDKWQSRGAFRLKPRKAIRVERTPADAVAISEGPEDALTAWLATGVETWAAFGFKGMWRMPFPAGRRVIILADNDPPGSDADKALRTEVERMIGQGLDVWIARAPEPHKDMNALLQAEGDDAVLAAVEAARPAAEVFGIEPPAPPASAEPVAAPTPFDDAPPSVPATVEPDPAPGPVDEFADFGIPTEQVSPWTDPIYGQLDISEKSGRVKNTEYNAVLALTLHPKWRGRVRYDEFADVLFAVKPPPFLTPEEARAFKPCAWSDGFTLAAVAWFQAHGYDLKKEVLNNALGTVYITPGARFHPVRDYLGGVQWDGRPRLDTWLSYYCGADLREGGIPEEAARAYLAAVGAKWMISAVARVFEPGCKVDHVLVIEGVQGIGKSSAAAALAGEWFTDQLRDVSSEDVGVVLMGKWIVELPELAAVRRAKDVEEVKKFITEQEFRGRLKYEKFAKTIPRQCVFMATTNQGEYLNDPTGNRRFWPVHCYAIDYDAIAADRDQLWAEAAHRYHAGERWHLDPQADEIALRVHKALVATRFEEDAWKAPLAEHLALATETTIADCLRLGLGMPTERHNAQAQQRVSKILREWGWKNRIVKRAGRTMRLYYLPAEE